MTRERAYHVHTPASLGTAIRHYRRTAHLTQAELSRKARVSTRSLVRLERGEETEQLRRLLRIFRALNLEMTLEQTTAP